MAMNQKKQRAYAKHRGVTNAKHKNKHQTLSEFTRRHRCYFK